MSDHRIVPPTTPLKVSLQLTAEDREIFRGHLERVLMSVWSLSDYTTILELIRENGDQPWNTLG